MNLDHLKYFVDAASKKSLSHAAKINRVSQSAISQSIRTLESQLNCQLIFHKRNRFQLTEAGETAFEESQRILESLNQMKTRVSERESDVAGELKIGCTNSIGNLILPEILTQIQKKYPKIKVKMRLGNSKVIHQWLTEQEVEVGFLVDESGNPTFNRVPIREGAYRLFSSPSMNRKSLTEEGIIVTRIERPEVQHIIRAYRSQFRKELKLRMEVTSWEVIKGLVLSGLGIGLCPEYVIATELKEKKIHLISVPRWKASYQIDFVHLRKRELSKQARLLLAAVTSGNKSGNTVNVTALN